MSSSAFLHVYCGGNKFADALARMGSGLQL